MVIPRGAWNQGLGRWYMAGDRYRVVDNGPHFVTCTVVNWLPLLNQPGVAWHVFESLRFLQRERRLTLYAYVVMENHLHMVVSAENLATQLRTFKSFTARQIIDQYQANESTHILKQLAWHKPRHKADSTHQFWQAGSHPQKIKDAAMMRQKIAYIHHNPVKRGWVDQATDWRYSSARNYAGQLGLLTVQTEWN